MHIQRLRVHAAAGTIHPDSSAAREQLAAFEQPKGVERPLIKLFEALCEYADVYQRTTGRKPRHEWVNLLDYARTLGTLDQAGRLYGPRIDDLAREIAESMGHKLPD